MTSLTLGFVGAALQEELRSVWRRGPEKPCDAVSRDWLGMLRTMQREAQFMRLPSEETAKDKDSRNWASGPSFWQIIWLCSVSLWPENLNEAEFKSNRLMGVKLYHCSCLLLSSRLMLREQQVQQKKKPCSEGGRECDEA